MKRITEVSRLICSYKAREEPEQSCRYNFQHNPAGWLHCAPAPKIPSSRFICIHVNPIYKALQNYAFQYLTSVSRVIEKEESSVLTDYLILPESRKHSQCKIAPMPIITISQQFFEQPLYSDVTSNYRSGPHRVPLQQNGITSQVTPRGGARGKC